MPYIYITFRQENYQTYCQTSRATLICFHNTGRYEFTWYSFLEIIFFLALNSSSFLFDVHLICLKILDFLLFRMIIISLAFFSRHIF